MKGEGKGVERKGKEERRGIYSNEVGDGIGDFVLRRTEDLPIKVDRISENVIQHSYLLKPFRISLHLFEQQQPTTNSSISSNLSSPSSTFSFPSTFLQG